MSKYSGLGDRHQQTVDGITTNYTLDLNAGLTQVLAENTNTYLYGNGRISQQAATTEYFLGDALGSVRQLVDAAGTVTLTQSYAPYGDTLTSEGDGISVFQYTGEARDESGLTYLRARYLNTGVGRFTSRDTWGGNHNRPLSLNRWNYVEGNPIKLTDPSGHSPYNPYLCDDIDCLVAYYRNYGHLVIRYKKLLLPTTCPTPSTVFPTKPWSNINYVFHLSYFEEKALNAFYELAKLPWMLNNGKMDLQKVIATAYKYELSSAGNAKGIKVPFNQAFARTYWDKCRSRTCDITYGIPGEGLIRLLGTLQGWFNRNSTNTRENDYPSLSFENVFPITNPIIQGAGPTGTHGKSQNAPSDWGNLQTNNPDWLKNWVAFAKSTKFAPRHDGEGTQEIWYSTGGEVVGLNNAFYILSQGQSGSSGLNCPGSCVMMPSNHPRPSWMDSIYSKPRE